MGLMDTLRSYLPQNRADPVLPLQSYIDQFFYGGNTYNFPVYPSLNTSLAVDREEIDANFEGLTAGALKRNGIVWACEMARVLLFSEARFQFQQLRGGRPGDLFGNESLDILEHPWPRATTGDLLMRAILDADLAGTAFPVRTRQDRITVLRPDWVVMVLAGDGESEINADLLGLIYTPGGPYSKETPVIIDASNVAVWAPIPDPLSKYRGLSWMSAVVPEIEADTSATHYKTRFFDGGATVNLVVQTGISNDLAKFQEWVKLFREGRETAAGKTLFLTPGADAKAIGATMQEMEYKSTQAAGETRIINASGMHPAIIGSTEGLSGSSLNEGNFQAARRLVADKTLRPLWRNFAGSMESIVPPPTGSRLWYDDRDIPFLAEDIKDRSSVQAEQAKTINSLITAGFVPDDVIDAVNAEDFERLKGKHTGLYSVQLQPPQPKGPPEPEPTLLLPNGQNGAAKPAPVETQ